jgi:hypothetical protein
MQSNENISVKMQCLTLDYAPDYLLNSEFSRAHDLFAAQDPHISYDINKTKLRTYNLYQIAQAVLKRFDNQGEMLLAGINFGTAALVLSHLLGRSKIRFIFIDPFDGRENKIVNIDPSIFTKRLPAVDYELIVGIIPNDLPKSQKLIFVHLNTNNPKAELDTLLTLIEQLEVGGSIVWDTYGWLDQSSKKVADEIIFGQDVFRINLPTRQLILIKY